MPAQATLLVAMALTWSLYFVDQPHLAWTELPMATYLQPSAWREALRTFAMRFAIYQGR